jgi:hypothetical protein
LPSQWEELIDTCRLKTFQYIKRSFPEGWKDWVHIKKRGEWYDDYTALMLFRAYGVSVTMYVLQENNDETMRNLGNPCTVKLHMACRNPKHYLSFLPKKPEVISPFLTYLCNDKDLIRIRPRNPWSGDCLFSAFLPLLWTTDRKKFKKHFPHVESEDPHELVLPFEMWEDLTDGWDLTFKLHTEDNLKPQWLAARIEQLTSEERMEQLTVTDKAQNWKAKRDLAYMEYEFKCHNVEQVKYLREYYNLYFYMYDEGKRNVDNDGPLFMARTQEGCFASFLSKGYDVNLESIKETKMNPNVETELETQTKLETQTELEKTHYQLKDSQTKLKDTRKKLKETRTKLKDARTKLMELETELKYSKNLILSLTSTSESESE